ncbi:Cysteine-rich repeat secretory protein 55-like protein [Drosera capensis]
MVVQVSFRFVIVFSLLLGCCFAGDDRSVLDPLGYYCDSNPYDYDVIPDFKKLVDELLLAIKAGTLYAPFTNVTVNKKDNYVYGLAQCRIDVEPVECATCINAAVQELVDDCQYEPDARVWYDWCMVRYSTTDFVGMLDTTCYVHFQSPEVATWDGFAKKRYDLFMKDIGSQIVKPWNQGFGKSVSQLDDYDALYGLASCTKDLTLYVSSTMALQALAAAVEQFQKICGNSIGCRVVTSSCYVRYETYPFFIPYNGKKNITTAKAKAETRSLP